MQNSTGYSGIEFLNKRKDCVRHLLKEGGFLHKRISDLQLEEQNTFIEDFVRRHEVGTAIFTFIKEIESQLSIALNPPVDLSENIMTEPNNNSVSSVLTPSGNKLTEKDENITTVTFPVLDSTPPDNISAQNIQSDSSTPASQTQPVQPAIPLSSPVTPSAPQQQLKPGEVPTAPATVQKSPPASELSKTSFSMSANGRANEEYRGKISGVNKSGKTVTIKQVDFPADLGLSFDADTSEIFGIPSQPGEFDLKVHFQYDPPSPADITPTSTCQLIVNPDPKTLWKNLDSDRTDKYWKEDTDTIYVPGNDGLAMIVASKRGRSHAHAGTFRDDDFKTDIDVLNGWRIMTVADGAGSAKKSREGSKIATRIANESVLKGLKGERGDKLKEALAAYNSDPSKVERPVKEELYYLFGNAAREAVQAITTVATTEGVPFKEFSTTLIITVHKKFEFGHFVGAYWVGDGGAGIYLKGQELNVLGKADSGEFAGQTRFLDTAMVDPTEIMNRIRFKVVQDFTAVIAMTDGITDPKFETDANIENIQMWDALWSDLEPTTIAAKPNEALLDWLDFWSAGNHDDRTIGILCPIKSGNSLQQGAN